MKIKIINGFNKHGIFILIITILTACGGGSGGGSDSDKDTTPVPSQPEPSQPEPNQPEPNQPEPSQPEPSQPEPVTPEPVAPEPVEPEPVTPSDINPTPPAKEVVVTSLDTFQVTSVNTVDEANDNLTLSWVDTNAASYRVIYWPTVGEVYEDLGTDTNAIILADTRASGGQLVVEAIDEFGNSVFSSPITVEAR